MQYYEILSFCVFDGFLGMPIAYFGSEDGYTNYEVSLAFNVKINRLGNLLKCPAWIFFHEMNEEIEKEQVSFMSLKEK